VALHERVSGFELSFLGRVFRLSPLVVNLEGFQLILGMDWLTKYGVSLDCGRRRLVVETPGFPREIYSYTSPSDAVLTSFLSSLGVAVRELCEIPVVRDFPDVFEEIPGPPPPREIEFRIDLVPGAGPVAKAPYRFAPKELEELKRQLEGLLEKRYVL
jgi:hypothetical protein